MKMRMAMGSLSQEMFKEGLNIYLARILYKDLNTEVAGERGKSLNQNDI